MDSTIKPINAALFDAVRCYYKLCVRRFVDEGRDLNSLAFLSAFPHVHIQDDCDVANGTEPTESPEEWESEQRMALLSAAFCDEFKERTNAAANVFGYNSQSSPRACFLELI